MEFWQYVALFVVLCSAPLIGMLLPRITPEERVQGERWFRYFLWLLAAVFFLLAFWLYRTNWQTFAVLIAAGLLLWIKDIRIKSAVLGLGFMFAARSPASEIFLIVLFLAAMTIGTLSVHTAELRKKMVWKRVLQNYVRQFWPMGIALPLYIT